MKSLFALLLFISSAAQVFAQDFRALCKEKRYEEALTALEQLSVKEKEKEGLFMRYAVDIALDNLKNTELARKYVEKTTDQAWKNFLDFYVAAKTGQTKAALSLAENNPVEKYPVQVQVEAWCLIGRIQNKMNDSEKALHAYKNAIKCGTGSIGAWFSSCKSAADILHRRGDEAGEEEIYKTCLERKAFMWARNECLFSYASLLIRNGKQKEALALLESEKPVFEKRQQGYWKVRFYLEYARTLAANKELVKAMDTYSKAENSGPTEAVKKIIQKERDAISQKLIDNM